MIELFVLSLPGLDPEKRKDFLFKIRPLAREFNFIIVDHEIKPMNLSDYKQSMEEGLKVVKDYEKHLKDEAKALKDEAKALKEEDEALKASESEAKLKVKSEVELEVIKPQIEDNKIKEVEDGSKTKV